jgi:hypothetical protein
MEDKRNCRYPRFTACTSLDIISIIKSEIVKWAGNVARIGTIKMHINFSSEYPKTRGGFKSRKIDALQDRKCTYNVTMRCVHVTIVAVGKKNQ